MSLGLGLSIARPTGVCAATGEPIEVAQPFVASLVERDDGLVRLDYSLGAWEGGARPAGALFGFWRSVMPDADAPKRQRIALGEAMDLFEGLGDAQADSRLAFRYVLALILIRKKQLVYEGMRDGLVLVRPRGVPAPPEGPPLIEVIDPGMDDDRSAEVAVQLAPLIDEGGA